MNTAMIVGRMMQLPLQSGDAGVSKIEYVVASGASAGTFNVMVLKPIAEVRVKAANDAGVLSMLETGMPTVFDTSALFAVVTPDGTSTGIPYLRLEIANG